MTTVIHLPQGPYTPRATPLDLAPGSAAPTSRAVFSAAHVVADPYADAGGGDPAAVDWESTLAFRRHLWAHGLGVAEAMDTAQRGMGLDWAGAAELIRRSAAEAKAVGGRIACGVGTDQLPEGPAPTLAEVTAAYEEQLALAERHGVQPILMASRALARAARGPEDYLATYAHLLRQASEPVILHWLGPMFDPALEGYWGSADLDEATGTFLKVIARRSVSRTATGRHPVSGHRSPASGDLFSTASQREHHRRAGTPASASGRSASRTSAKALSSPAMRLALSSPQVRQWWMSIHSPSSRTDRLRAVIRPPQPAARSPGTRRSTCRLTRQDGQWLRWAVPGATTDTSSRQPAHRNASPRAPDGPWSTSFGR
ncbi:hypothetical protein SCALM49S_01701 [Streptomyces californicus]